MKKKLSVLPVSYTHLDVYKRQGCMEAFGEAWRKLGEHQEKLGLELSQQVRFMESDQGTNLNYFESYYPLHEIEFSAYSEAALRELEAQVDEEQLAFMRRWEPARYEAIQKGRQKFIRQTMC